MKVKAHRSSNPSDGIDWIELLETILVNRLPTITREEIKTMFGLQDTDLKKTRFYQDTFNEGRQEGLEQGIKQGLENGVRKGREEGEVALLLRILERRFGPLSVNVKQRIASTDAETLLIYGERVLDAITLDDIFGDATLLT
jgi:predicted transposase YdaD